MGARIEAVRLPLSPAGRAVVAAEEGALVRAMTGGDDYELLFTASADREPELARIAAELNLPLTRIGEIVAEPGLTALDQTGRPIALDAGGWRHF